MIKKVIILLFATFIISMSNLLAQGVAINSDGSNADVSAMLDVKSTVSGVLIPRMTKAIRDVLSSPAKSLLIFQTDNTPGYYYNSGTPAIPIWERLATGEDLGFVDGTGTATRVAFWTNTNTLGSNANLFWDNTNGRLGIGTSSPQEKLHISANSSTGYPSIMLENTIGHTWEFWPIDGNDLRIRDVTDGVDRLTIKGISGNIGINTTSPTAKLHVDGTVRFQNLGTGTQTTGLMVDASGNISSRTLNISNWDDAYSWGDHAAEGYLTSFSEVDPTWNGTANQTGTIGRSGNVGIGTTSPAYKLDVRNGAHIATSSNSSPFIVSRNYKTTNHEELRLGVDDSNLFFHYLNDETSSKIQFRLQNTDTEAGGGANASDYTIMTLSANSTEGRVGIGTISPSSQLHTTGTVRFANYPSGANGAILRTDASGNLAITNFTGNTSDILLGNNTFGTIEDAGGVVSSCGTANYLPKMTNATSMSCSQVFDNGTNVGIGTTSPSEKLDIYGATKNIEISNTAETDAGIIFNDDQATTTQYAKINYGSSDNDLNFLNASATPRMVIESSGEVGIGTISPTEKLHVVGNAKATGYITAGSATTTSTTRYGSQTIKWKGSESVDDGYKDVTVGTFEIPDNIPSGTTIYIDRIVWTCDGMHQDADEEHGLHVKIGSSSYYGWTSSIQSGANYIDWQFDTGSTSITNFTTDQNLTMQMYDSGGSGGDNLLVYMMHITVYYHYSSALQSGDIAASGRIYANNNTAVGDLAEHFEYKGPIAPGYIISYIPGTDNEYEMCNKPYSDHITGVISENPSVVLNSPEQGPPLALAGRVNVKLVDSDELIKGGDFITSSSVAGFGMKAKKPGPVIGYAVKNQKQGENFVEILLQPGKYYIPQSYILEFEDEDTDGNKKYGKY